VLSRNTRFEVIPAIDVLEGRVVRLSQGRREKVTLEGGDPAALAERYTAEGAVRLHLVDLDGAFAGNPSAGLLASVAAATPLPVQVGGGYRTLEAIDGALAEGADRVMVGTSALAPGFLRAAAERFHERLVVAVDVKDGHVAVDGWTKAASLTPEALVEQCVEAEVARLLVTSTRRDGSLAGPDIPLLKLLLPYGLPVLAAGGIAELGDLVAARDLGCEGAIAGSALLKGRFTLAEARAATVER
jgi:phosphoribosylformimino-5-aminoimidazole carboxamide ribotide isomerase